MLPTEVKPIKCPVTEKNKTKTNKSKENNNNNNNMNKNEGRKAASGGEDAKSKSYSATSFADIFYLEWVTKCLIYKQNVGQFWLIIAKTVKKQLDWFQKVIFGKIPRGKWVNVYILLLFWLLTLVLSVLVTVHVVTKNKKQPKILIASWVLNWLMFLILHYKFRHVCDVVQIYPWFKFYFLSGGYGNVW